MDSQQGWHWWLEAVATRHRGVVDNVLKLVGKIFLVQPRWCSEAQG